MTQQQKSFVNAEEVEEVVRRFESCEVRPDDFKHRDHLIVALRYLLDAPDEDALERIRTNLRRFIRTHGVDPAVYHETITAFWMKRVRAYVERAGARRTFAEIANGLLEDCNDARLVFDYYSKELIDSERARREWTEPDLKPLDF